MALDTTLAQALPVATVLTDLYTVPPGKRSACYVVVTNQAATSATYRISIAIAGAVDAQFQYVVYDKTIAANDSPASKRLALSEGDVVRVYSSTSTLSFAVNGIEQDQ